jgi:hypothetical protein
VYAPLFLRPIEPKDTFIRAPSLPYQSLGVTIVTMISLLFFASLCVLASAKRAKSNDPIIMGWSGMYAGALVPGQGNPGPVTTTDIDKYFFPFIRLYQAAGFAIDTNGNGIYTLTPCTKFGFTFCLISIGGGTYTVPNPSDTVGFQTNAINSILALINSYGAIGVEINFELFSLISAERFTEVWKPIIQAVQDNNFFVFASPYSGTNLWYKTLHNAISLDYVAFQIYGSYPADHETLVRNAIADYPGAGILPGIDSDRNDRGDPPYPCRGTNCVLSADGQSYPGVSNFIAKFPQVAGWSMFTW